MKPTAEWANKLLAGLKRYKYAAIVIVIGLALLLIPSKKAEEAPSAASPVEMDDQLFLTQIEERLQQLLGQMRGAGEVRVMLTLKTGSETRYQTDTSTVSETKDGSERTQEEQKTVLISAGSAYDEAAVSAVEYPRFQGALILCQGADDPTVKLGCINAVSALTGLSSDRITVVKMN